MNAGKSFPPKDETITNNIYKSVTWDGATIGLTSSGNFTGDPKFINPAAGDFHLQANSSACSAGAFPCDNSNSPLPTSTATLTVAPTIAPTKVPTLQPTMTFPSEARFTQESTQTPITMFTFPPVNTETATLPPTSEPPTFTATASLAPALPTPTETSIPPTPTSTETPVSIPPTPTATVESLPTEKSTEPPTSETIYDDKDSALVYSSGWRDSYKGTAYQGSFKETSKNGASITLDFTGQSFSILYKSGWAYRTLDIYVDGVLVGTINENSRRQAFQQRWDYPGQLVPGTHTLKLVFVAQGNRTKGSFDAVIIR